MRSYGLKSVKDQYEKYPYPSYDRRETIVIASWLKQRGLQANRIIDIGCGTGLWSIAFARNGSHVTAVDFSSASLSHAAKMADECGVSITFRRADLFSLETSETYDLVFCNGVLHHTANGRNGFHRISGFVDRGGLLAISLYNRLSPFRLAKFLVQGFGRGNIEARKLVARTVVSLPLSTEILAFSGRSQPGPSSSVREYISRDENLVDLLCHAHTSYHSVWEVEKWYVDEGFEFIKRFPSGSISAAILPNLVFYVGKRPGSLTSS